MVFPIKRFLILVVVVTLFGGDPLENASRASQATLTSQVGVLRVALEPDTDDYFLLNGLPVGRQLAIAERMAEGLGLRLEVVGVADSNSARLALRRGDVDLYAPSRALSTPLDLRAIALEAIPAIRFQGAFRVPTWEASRSAHLLAHAVEDWSGGFARSSEARAFAMRYGPRGYLRRGESSGRGSLSPYDSLLREASVPTRWDWRWLAALVYQESRFRADVHSRRGARGLTQLMPGTVHHLKLGHIHTPEGQIAAGVRYLELLDRFYASQGVTLASRDGFILAAYNGGVGRVEAAQAEAKRQGLSPIVWEGNVATCLGDPTAAGSVAHYVESIARLSNHYQNMIIQ